MSAPLLTGVSRWLPPTQTPWQAGLYERRPILVNGFGTVTMYYWCSLMMRWFCVNKAGIPQQESTWPSCEWRGLASPPPKPMLVRLPPDPEGMNTERAVWAATALHRFALSTRCDEEERLGDLLCDLMHWCDRSGKDFNNELRKARAHYKQETTA